MRGVPGVDRGFVVGGVVGGVLAAGNEEQCAGEQGDSANWFVKRVGHHGQKFLVRHEMQEG